MEILITRFADKLYHNYREEAIISSYFDRVSNKSDLEAPLGPLVEVYGIHYRVSNKSDLHLGPFLEVD